MSKMEKRLEKLEAANGKKEIQNETHEASRVGLCAVVDHWGVGARRGGGSLPIGGPALVARRRWQDGNHGDRRALSYGHELQEFDNYES